MSPTSILERIQKGDRDAEQMLVQKYWKNLVFILNHRANDSDLAAEIAQESFIVVIKKARNGDIDNPLALGAFIRQVGINLLIAAYRKEARRKTEAAENIDIHPYQQLDLANKLNEKQLSEIVTNVINELPSERDKELLFRFFVYGHEKRVICDEFALSAAHFDRVLHRARARLKQVLQLKLNIDTETVDLSHLLSVGLLSVTLIQPNSNNTNYLTQQVRECEGSHHYNTNTDLLINTPTLGDRQMTPD